MRQCDVLIAGAGPTGLALALWLARQGVRARIIDKTAEPGTTSRALAVQARTLELYRQLDLTETVVARGHKTPAVNLWVKGERAARIPFEDVGAGLTPYPFLHIFPQDQHERLLIERLQEFGVSVERRTELLGFEERPGTGVEARLRGPDGAETTAEASYIAGCDGARSVVRDTIGTGFPGGTYRQLFYVADAECDGPPTDGELHVDLDQADFLAVFPIDGGHRVRLIGTVRDQRAEHPEALKFEDVRDRAIEHLKVVVRRINWFSTYHVHHRVTGHFRRGRAFLLGDAAHIHSPAGGQGMNTGIGDAINLAWKLAAVIGGRADDRLLDSYEAERIGFARELVATTDRVFSFATAEGPVADFLRARIAPWLIPGIAGFEAAREFIFRRVGQLALNYRDGPLSVGRAGRVHGGDRLPWVVSASGDNASGDNASGDNSSGDKASGDNASADNYASLTAIAWQAHVYGTPADGLSAWCSDRGLALHVFDWRPEHLAAGLERDGLYLLRPDSYVALAAASDPLGALERYFAEHGVSA